jgi:hypothetical protein
MTDESKPKIANLEEQEAEELTPEESEAAQGGRKHRRPKFFDAASHGAHYKTVVLE